MKAWFAILQESEISQLHTASEIAVFMAIKSFCANGKQTASLSSREIAQRAKCHHQTVIRIVKQLLKLGVIETLGFDKHNGGETFIYKVSRNETPTLSKGVAPRDKGVAPRDEGVAFEGSKHHKVKRKKEEKKFSSEKKALTSRNSLTPCTQIETWQIAMDFGIAWEAVVAKEREILELIDSGEYAARKYKGKTLYLTLKQWLRMGIAKGYIPKLEDTELIYQESQKPAEGTK